MTALVILSLGGNDFDKVTSYYQKKQNELKPNSLLCFATLGMMDFVIIADEAALDWVHRLLSKLKLRMGFQGVSSDGLTQVYRCDFRFQGDLDQLVDSQTLCLLRHDEKTKQEQPPNGDHWWPTDGSFQHLAFFQEPLATCVDSRILAIRRLGFQSFCMPLIPFARVLEKPAASNGLARKPSDPFHASNIQVALNPELSLVRLWACVEPGYEKMACEVLKEIVQQASPRADASEFHLIHGQADFILTPEIPFDIRRLVHGIWTRNPECGILSIHAFLHHPWRDDCDDNLETTRKGGTHKSPVSPFLLPLVVGGRDWSAKHKEILKEFDELCKRVPKSMVKCKALEVRILPGEAGPQIHQDKRDARHETLFLELSHQLLDSKQEALITHELHLAFTILALDNMKDLLFTKCDEEMRTLWRKTTENNHREHFYRYVGETIATALGIWNLAQTRTLEGEALIQTYVEMLGLRWHTLDSGRWMRLVVGYFLYRVLVSETQVEEDQVLAWVARIVEAEGFVSQVLKKSEHAFEHSETSEHALINLVRDVLLFGLWPELKHKNLSIRILQGRKVFSVTWNWMIRLLFGLSGQKGHKNGAIQSLGAALFDLLANAEPDLERQIERCFGTVKLPNKSVPPGWAKFLGRLMDFSSEWVQREKPGLVSGPREHFSFYRDFACQAQELVLLSQNNDWLPEFVGVASEFRRHTLLADEPNESGAMARAVCGFEFLTRLVVGHRSESFFLQLKTFVSPKYVMGPTEDPSLLDAGALLRRMDTELRALEASLGYLRKNRQRWQEGKGPHAIISFNATPWLLFPDQSESAIGGPMTAFLRWNTGNPWFAAYRGSFLELAQALTSEISSMGYTPVIELVEGLVPFFSEKGSAQQPVQQLWAVLEEVKHAARSGKMGFAIDDMFGPGTDLKRLVHLMERAMLAGFDPLVIKIDFHAVSSILWQGNYLEDLKNDQMPWHWETAFVGIFQLILTVIQVLHEKTLGVADDPGVGALKDPPRFVLVVEGFDGPGQRDWPKDWLESGADFGHRYRKYFAEAIQHNADTVLQLLPNKDFQHTAEEIFKGILLQGI